MTYKIGDRVRITEKRDIANPLITKGMVGEIIRVKPDGLVCVEFDKCIKGHSCSGVGRDEHCWWIPSRRIEPVSVETKKIVITSDGKETLARLYEGNKVIKKAVAKCSPEDEYNFEIGARIAFDRLMGDKPVFELIGNFSLANNGVNELEITCEVEQGKYKKHFVYLNEWTIYTVEDVSGAYVSNYHYEVNYLPEMIIPVTITVKD